MMSRGRARQLRRFQKERTVCMCLFLSLSPILTVYNIIAIASLTGIHRFGDK